MAGPRNGFPDSAVPRDFTDAAKKARVAQSSLDDVHAQKRSAALRVPGDRSRQVADEARKTWRGGGAQRKS